MFYLVPSVGAIEYNLDSEGVLIPGIREGRLDYDVCESSSNEGHRMKYGRNYIAMGAPRLHALWDQELLEDGDVIFGGRLNSANDHDVHFYITAYKPDTNPGAVQLTITDDTENKTLYTELANLTSLMAWSMVYGSGVLCFGFGFYQFTVTDPIPNYMRFMVWDRIMNTGYPGTNASYQLFGEILAEYPSTATPATEKERRELLYQDLVKVPAGEQNPKLPPPSEPKGSEGLNGYEDYNIDFPDSPTTSAVATDLLRLYRLNNLNMSEFAAFLWSDAFIDNIKKMFGDPMDNIISLNILPVDITGTNENIKIGNLDSGVLAQRLSGQFLTMDFHSVQIPKMWGNQLDFQPATTCQIFIPYIGYRDIDLDDASGGTVSLKIRLDLLSGDILAMVKITQEDRYYHDSVEYFFDGNCAVNIPLSGANYGQIYAAYVGTGLGFTASALTGNVPGMMASAAGGVSSILTGKPSYQRSGSIGGARGYMGLQKAFILISSPVPSIPGSITQIKGLRSNIYSAFSLLTGFQVIQDYIPNSTLVSACTNKELEEINKLLMEGVIF